jgi:murein DD-endopeptidase MepM/ murein hydrolase activator NlpD
VLYLRARKGFASSIANYISEHQPSALDFNLMFPTHNRALLRIFAFVIMTFAAMPAHAEVAEILTTPASLANGSPFLLTISLESKASTVTGQWQRHPIIFFSAPDHRTWYSLAGVDVETTPGHYRLTVEIDPDESTHRTLHKELDVEEAPYEKVPLDVPDKFVEPNAAALKIIAADKIVKDKAFAHSSAKPEWSSNFLPPLRVGAMSDSFGSQRIFNGKLASIHRGLDYHAKSGTPISAINSGRVVLARPLYFEGGCVVIDHGLGLMSVYMHLSKIDVAVGAKVHRGQLIALSGASGRATGPHLHLGVRWQGSYLDPAKLFDIQLPSLH